MSTIVTRAGKGSPLTNTELDSNFTNLNTDKLELSGGSLTGNLSLGDNVKAQFGAGDDLEIFSNGSTALLKAGNATSDIRIESDNRIVIADRGFNEAFAVFNDDSDVKLYHDGSLKIATTATGADITGVLTADGLTVDGGTASPIINLSRSGTYSGITFSQTVTNVTGAGADLSTYSLNANTGYVWQTCDSGGTTAKALLIAPNRDISFYNDSAAQGLFWDSSTSRLGLGVTNPAEILHLNSTSGSARIRMTSSDSTDCMIVFGNQTDNATGAIRFDHSDNSLTFNGYNNSERLKINADGSSVFSGNVGIGSIDPSSKFTNYKNTSISGTGGATLSLEINTEPRMMMTTDSSVSYISSFDSNPIVFSVTAGNFGSSTGTERMRIDSSGNVLISTTDTAVGAGDTNTGISLQAAGRGFFSIASDYAGRFNRNTSDGDLVTFAKDGSTVGSIGTYGSDLVITSSVSGHKGLRFGLNHIAPIDTSYSYTDATTDLGLSDVRFKDLYLSGSANVGGLAVVGTGSISANTSGIGGSVYNANTSGTVLKLRSGSVGGTAAVLGIFDGNNTEKARFTASGNLLVGKTSQNLATEGISINPLGYIQVTESQSPTLYLNRLGTDGSIINFYKDGSSVGSIGTKTSDLFIGSTNGSNHCYLRFAYNNTRVVPSTNTGEPQDNALDLGDPAVHFKDLYLSGTANANKYAHDGDSDTYFNFPAANQLSLVGGGAEIVRAYQIAGAYGVLKVNGSGSATYPNFTFNGDDNTGMYRATTDTLAFTTGGTERTRIASNGTLYHGKTADSLNTGGLQTLISGQTSITQSYTEPLRLNRMSSQGAIQKFYYNGAEVGSIGTPYTGELYIEGSGANSSGLLFTSGNTIQPRKNGAADNGNIDLGTSGNRFKDLYLSGKIYGSTLGIGDAGIQADQYNNAVKPFRPDITSGTSDNYLDLGTSSVRWVDLYLSGGVYLGGTGAANLLDDYEEGTWTLTTTTSGVTISSQSCRYTKVGRLVTLTGSVYFSVLPSNLSTMHFSGAPFNCWAQHSVGIVREVSTTGAAYILQINANTGNFGMNSYSGVASGSARIFAINEGYNFSLTYTT